MRIAMGIVGVLLVLAIIYYFLPQGLKTTISAVFTGSSTPQQARQNSPSPLATTTAAVNTTPSATTQATWSSSPVGIAANNRTSPSPSATSGGSIAGAITASGTPRAIANSGTSLLPGTGFENQPIELTIIQILGCTLLSLVGFKLAKHI